MVFINLALKLKYQPSCTKVRNQHELRHGLLVKIPMPSHISVGCIHTTVVIITSCPIIIYKFIGY